MTYRVSLPADADREVRVEACARGLGAVRWVQVTRTEQSPFTDVAVAGECVRYTARPAAGFGRFPVLATREAFVGGHASLFLVPANAPPDSSIEVRFDAPEGVRASTPWPTSAGVARPDGSFFVREAHVAFGEGMRIARFGVPGASVERVRVGGALSVTDEELDRWLHEAIDAVAALTGTFPRARLHVVVVPTADGGTPVLFGLARRGGGASVLLLVSEDADLGALRRDWVAVHELAHLVFPMVDRDDAWLAEGLATYYQEVLRARAGLIAPREAWARFVAGIDRGRRGTASLPLGLESEQMMARRSFHRVYWSGAVFALLVDLELRDRGASLDGLVAARARELLRAPSGIPAEQLLDLLGGPEFGPLLRARAAELESSTSFPEVEPALAALGIAKGPGGELIFSDEPAARARRAAIMGGE